MKPFFILNLLIISLLNPAFASFFDRADAFFKKQVQNGLVAYDAIQSNPKELEQLLQEIAAADLSKMDATTKKAFYINAYNLFVIRGALDHYPLSSVLNVPDFFDKKKYEISGKQRSLNELEKEWLLKSYADARLHFVLVCGAVGCPPITDFAYRPEELEAQLEQQTRLALNNTKFIRVNDDAQQVELSQIFEWYSTDFGGSKKSAVEFINRYRYHSISTDYNVSFYKYDWSLNEIKSPILETDVQKSNNDYRYVVSASIPKGTTETKIFNNLYSQTTGTKGSDRTERANFYTMFITSLYGLTNRLNVGLEVRYRQATFDRLPASPLDVFRFEQTATSRFGVATIGPKVRFAPSAQLPNFSIQSAFWIPLRNDWEGTGERPYLDWNNPTWWTQFFNDFSIGENFALFAEIDALWEDLGNGEQGALNRFSTPVTLIGSYFPTPKATVYVLTNYSPYWSPQLSYFWQAGVGTKYQLTPKFEVEALYSYFTNEFLASTNGRASTFNVGIRFNR
ncbi:MAG TPA: DUF547 domain-containing protein [Saprospiraceae bacterium]|nr:DUF547 domain-containing protein [Saprospiraceae bacterium]HMP13494.1 DUF547 domain-containing protein [Saprospiraceae bacterium]